MRNTGIIIQARQGSTRFPGKVLKDFYNDQSILEVLINKFKKSHKNLPLILVTTQNKEDDAIEQLGKKHNVPVYRGSTENVLSRFIEAAEKHNIDNIIRVCADNPFLDTRHLDYLIRELEKGNYDYVSYQTPDGTPSIQSHLGLFTEAVRLEALKKVAEKTKNPLYLEHVTNYIYQYPEEFKVNLLELPSYFRDTENIRLTIDTPEDFELSKEIYKELRLRNTYKLLKHIKSRPEWLAIMEKEIQKNKK